MGYIPGFEHDIFLSYAHVDNLVAGEDSDEKGWVAQFHRQLEIALAQRLGRVGLVKIWRDKKLEGDHLFNQTIHEGMQKSALFVAILSNGYLASRYCCEKELAAFYQKAGGETFGRQIGDRSRIYAVLINNIPHQQWPPEFAGISGHPLYEAEEKDDLGEPTDQSEKKFKSQLRALVDSLYKMLLAFKEKAETPAAATATIPPPATQTSASGPIVFVADVPDSLRTTRNRLISELQRKDVRIVTGMPPPYEAPAHEQKVKSALQEAALSVHLLDLFAGREIEGQPEITYPQKQAELAKGLAGAQLIWVPKALDLSKIDEPGYQGFLQQLEQGVRERAQYDFVRSTAATLAPQILEKLEQLRTAAPSGKAKHAVLLDTHLKDQLHALELSKYFLTHDVQPYINPQEDDPNKNMDVLEARLKEVNILMILYGSVNSDWVRQRLGAALQLSVIKALAIKAFCVVNVPPVKSPEALNFNLGPIPVQLIDLSAGSLDSPKLVSVLQSAQAGGAA